MARILGQPAEQVAAVGQVETEERRLQRLLMEGIQSARPDLMASVVKQGPNKYQIDGKPLMVKLIGENSDQVLIRKGTEWVRIPEFFFDLNPPFTPGGGNGRLGYAGSAKGGFVAKAKGKAASSPVPRPKTPGRR